MLSEAEKAQFSALKAELYQLLLSEWCYVRKFDALGHRIKKESRKFLLEEMQSLRVLSNDIILRLCNLDEDKSGYSLVGLRKYVFSKKKVDAKFTSDVNGMLKKYRSTINILKINHQNSYIAHLSGDDMPNLLDLPDLRETFIDPTRLAILACEKLWGAPLNFEFRLGSQDPTIHFQEELGIDKA
jgi:hypothetical protein